MISLNDLKIDCPECGDKKTCLLLESARGSINYDFYRCLNCGFAFKRMDDEIVEVSEKEADKITERSLIG